MTKEWIDAITNICTTLGGIAGGVVAIVKYLEYLKAKASEKSVGATKVKELEAAIKKVNDDMEKVTKDNVHYSKAIEDLKEDLKDLMHQISVAFFGKNR